MTDLVFKSICWVCRGMHKTGLNPFFFFCWLEIDLKKLKNRTFSVCLSLLCLSICPTFLEFVFSCLCSTFFHSKEKQIHLCPSCFSCCFLQSFPLWMYSMPLLLLFYFVTVHPYTHRWTHIATKKPSVVRVDVTSSILNSITSADYHLPFAV